MSSYTAKEIMKVFAGGHHNGDTCSLVVSDNPIMDEIKDLHDNFKQDDLFEKTN